MARWVEYRFRMGGNCLLLSTDRLRRSGSQSSPFRDAVVNASFRYALAFTADSASSAEPVQKISWQHSDQKQQALYVCRAVAVVYRCIYIFM